MAPNYPMIGDTDLNVSKLYGMLPADRPAPPKAAPPANNATVRNVFIIGPDKKIKLLLVYPMTTGRNFDEILRVIDSMQLTAKHKVATPADWKQGGDVIITGAVSDDEAKTIYPRLQDAQAVPADRAAAEELNPRHQPFATNRAAVDETAVTQAPQEISTTATGQLQCLSSDSDVRSKVA